MNNSDMMIEGVIYPISKDIAKNIFDKRKSIFIKYLTHEPSKKTELKLKKGMNLYIYVSKENKSIMGEARINDIYYMNSSEILNKFKGDLFLSEIEFKKYVNGREDKKAQVLKLENIRTYKKMIPVKRPITMTGLYITQNNKKDIFGK